ncbi:MAG TPA: hypothetical protein VF145_13235 [Chitinophagaceae bacterium]
MRSLVAIILTSLLAFTACKKSELLSYPALTEYYPLKPGKTFLYRLDSTVRLPFGTGLTVKYFLAKDSVESQFSDAQGRPSFRLFRFLRDTAQLQPWAYKSTIVVTIDNEKKWIEYIENNLRFIALHQPVTEGFSWKGNSYIDTRSGNSLVKYMDDWNYTYSNVNQSFTVKKGTFDSTITVLQVDEVSPPGPFNPSYYQQTNLSKEIYAKGVGLVYKEFLHKTWDLSPNPHWVDDSYGIKLNLVDFK